MNIYIYTERGRERERRNEVTLVTNYSSIQSQMYKLQMVLAL